jgi:hypothetical protein
LFAGGLSSLEGAVLTLRVLPVLDLGVRRVEGRSVMMSIIVDFNLLH